MRIDGAWTALVTPMGQDFGIDYDGLEKNVEFQLSEGITGVLPVGTTGESPTLSWSEHNGIIEKTLHNCRGRRPVLAGTGSNSTSEAISSTRHAAEAGADAVLLVDCYYNGPSSQELRDEYYHQVATRFPDTIVIPYIIPGRSGTALAVEDLAILADRLPNISAVKEATGDLQRMARTRALTPEGFSIMSGDDDVTLKMMLSPEIRADGVISVVSNVVPGAVAEMVRLAKQHDQAGAQRMQDALAPLLGMVTVKVDNARVLPNGETATVNDRYRNPLPIKTLMAGLGMPSGPCRRPLGRMLPSGVEVVRNVARQVWERNPEVLQPIGEFYHVDIASRLADDTVWEALSV